MEPTLAPNGFDELFGGRGPVCDPELKLPEHAASVAIIANINAGLDRLTMTSLISSLNTRENLFGEGVDGDRAFFVHLAFVHVHGAVGCFLLAHH